MEAIIIISDHAFDRSKECLGLNKKATLRLAEKAYHDGIKHSDMHGVVYKYISSLAERSPTKDISIMIYGEAVYLFSKKDNSGNMHINQDGTPVIILITVIPLPNNLKSLVKKQKIVNKDND